MAAIPFENLASIVRGTVEMTREKMFVFVYLLLFTFASDSYLPISWFFYLIFFLSGLPNSLLCFLLHLFFSWVSPLTSLFLLSSPLRLPLLPFLSSSYLFSLRCFRHPPPPWLFICQLLSSTSRGRHHCLLFPLTTCSRAYSPARIPRPPSVYYFIKPVI